MPFVFASGKSILEAPHFSRSLSRVEEGEKTPSMNFNEYGNAVWCVIVTITTGNTPPSESSAWLIVGYGDYFPRTYPGRVVMVLMSSWGMFLSSLTVVTLSNALLLDPLEAKANLVVERTKVRQELRLKAGKFIAFCMSLCHRSRKGEQLPEADALRLKVVVADFRISLREYKSNLESSNVNEEIARNLDYMRQKFKDLVRKYHEIEDSSKKMEDLTDQIVLMERARFTITTKATFTTPQEVSHTKNGVKPSRWRPDHPPITDEEVMIYPPES